MLTTGQVIQNRYRIETLLGQGGFGAVYNAWDLMVNMLVIIKENLDASTEAQRQFQHEAQILSNLSHPNLPRVMDYFLIPGTGQYLVMEYVEGEDLQSISEKHGHLSEGLILLWMAQVCDALAYLHSRTPPIIHCDIKPANIKITPQGQAVLVDFGISKIYDPHLKTTVGAKAVTPGYSPPEQYGLGKIDVRSDIYALGASMYVLLTGQVPPDSIERLASNVPLIPPRQIVPDISPQVEATVLKATELLAEQRFPSVREFRQALFGQTLYMPLPPVAQPAIPFPQLAPASPQKQVVPVSLLVLGGIAGLLVLLAYLVNPSNLNQTNTLVLLVEALLIFAVVWLLLNTIQRIWAFLTTRRRQRKFSQPSIGRAPTMQLPVMQLPSLNVCPQCGTSNNPTAEFCKACGMRLRASGAAGSPPVKSPYSPYGVCANGHPQIRFGARFCYVCGAPLLMPMPPIASTGHLQPKIPQTREHPNDTGISGDQQDMLQPQIEANAVARVTDMPDDDQFRVGNTYHLQAGVLPAFASTAGFEATQVRLPMQPEEFRIDIVVHAEDMEVQPWIKSFTFHHDAKHELAEFEITPQRPGHKRIQVEFLHERYWLGQIEFTVDVVGLVVAVP